MAATLGLVTYTSTPVQTAEAATSHTHSSDARSRAGIAFRNKMRKLWEDHIVWTRQSSVSSVADLADADTAAGRLLANQDHIGNAIKPFYGDEAGEALSAL